MRKIDIRTFRCEKSSNVKSSYMRIFGIIRFVPGGKLVTGRALNQCQQSYPVKMSAKRNYDRLSEWHDFFADILKKV